MTLMEYSLKEEIETYNKELEKIPELTRNLLLSRGVVTLEEAEMFLDPDYEVGHHDPFLMFGMKKAVERILKAVEKNEKIIVYSDYDADGIPGGVVLRDFFKRVKFENFENYIPHRHDEGFGLNKEAILDFAEKGTNLLITVDCGITDVAEIDEANKFGIDVIVTDHHEPNGKVPETVATLNPKQEKCGYPFSELCGAGVAYKLVQAILREKDFGIKKGMEKWSLDMVGLATLSDMVPLRDENRIFAHYGLQVLRKSPRPGLMKLLRKLKINQRHLNEDDISFMITPRINAASRMGSPDTAFELLSTEDEVIADKATKHLDSINNERKWVVAGIVKHAKKHFSEREKEEMKKVIVMGNPNWRPSLLGLAANTLAEEYNRPVFLWGRDGGNSIKGSARSDGIVDLVKLMEKANRAFKQFGGHKFAGGFSVSNEKIHTLEEELIKAYEALYSSGERSVSQILVDKVAFIDEVNWDVWRQIEKLAPFGVGNPKPVFLFQDILISEVKMFGKEKNHLELSFQNSKGKKVKAIGFFMKPEQFKTEIEKGKKINLVANMEKSMFGGVTELRLRIINIF